MRNLIIVVFLVGMFSGFGFSQTTWYVDNTNVNGPWLGTQFLPFKYIGVDPGVADGGIEAASSGDTIIVMKGAGVYFETIDFLGKDVVVKPESGASITIDGEQKDSVVKCISGETSAALLEGFTIANGKSYTGGGIQIISSSPTIRNNIIEKCEANGGKYYGGGGVYCYNSSTLLEKNTIRNNSTNYTGGGVFCMACTDTNNPVLIKNNTLHDNNAYWGGGLCITNSIANIFENKITDNSAYYSGGGIYSEGGSTTTIYRNEILYNQADGGKDCGGGGVYLHADSGQLVNNMICQNSAQYYCGGGVYFAYCYDMPVVNNTICDNHAVWGGGVYCCHGTTLKFSNNILWENTCSNSGAQVYIEANCILTSVCSLIEGGWTGPGNDNLYGDPNDDPQFVDAINGDYRLLATSACINRGTKIDAPSEDLYGDVRPHMGAIDIGADEFTGIHWLEADVFTVSSQTGGPINFTLDAGSSYAGKYYLMFGSISGTNPGVPFSNANLPLKWDMFTNIIIKVYWALPGFHAQLSGTGTSTALFPVPATTGFIGTILHFSYLLGYPLKASNPVSIEIVP